MFKPKGSDCRDFDIIPFEGKLWMVYIRSGDGEDVNDLGLASSIDGYEWQEEGIILKPSVDGWDCKSLWAMHLTTNADGFVLYYSALGKGSRLHQSIGVAYSKDLKHWERDSRSPILELLSDNQFYSNEIDKIDKWYPDEPAILFRDPYSFQFEDKKYLVFAAKDKAIHHENNACVGLAEINLDGACTFLPPIYSPEKYHITECPALYQIEGKWVLVFCDDDIDVIRYAVSDSPFGGFTEPQETPLLPPENYVGRIIDWNGQHLFFYHTPEHMLADPKILTIEGQKLALNA